MKKIHFLLIILSVIFVTGCATVKVERYEDEDLPDLSGYWNANDVSLVAKSLVNQCVDAPAITNYIVNNGELPVVIVGTFKNQSDEHIDTSIIAQKFEAALINSGKVSFVADASQREELREERLEQQEWASEETASRLANELGADFMLIGSVKTIVDAIDNKATRTYYVTTELIDIESNRKLWVSDPYEIKKSITRPKTRF